MALGAEHLIVQSDMSGTRVHETRAQDAPRARHHTEDRRRDAHRSARRGSESSNPLFGKLTALHAEDPRRHPKPPARFNWYAPRHIAISCWNEAGLAPKGHIHQDRRGRAIVKPYWPMQQGNRVKKFVTNG